jgi:hypothetical protein
VHYDWIFLAINLVVAPVWLLMMVAPRWRVTERVVRGGWAPLAVAAIYVVLILTHMGATNGHFFSLDGVSQLFTDRGVVLAGWAHYLCFDLMVGSWISRDAQRAGVAHWLVLPCLFLALMFGPSGLLLYFAVRGYKTRELALLA